MNGDEGGDERSEVAAGAGRALARAGGARIAKGGAKSIAKRNLLGRLPKRHALRLSKLGKGADNVGSLVDASESIQLSHDERRALWRERGSSSSSSSSWGVIRQGVWRVLRNSLPPFIQTAALGTLLFGVYETLCESWRGGDGDTVLSLREEAALSALSGALAGGAHGGVSQVFQVFWPLGGGAAVPWRQQWRAFIGGLPRMTAGDALSHAMLFGSYEMSKRCLLDYFDDPEDGDGERELAVRTGAVATAGAVAGLAQHTLWRVVEPALHNVETPSASLSFRGLVAAALPASIGFLAFEFAKDVIDSEID